MEMMPFAASSAVWKELHELAEQIQAPTNVSGLVAHLVREELAEALDAFGMASEAARCRDASSNEEAMLAARAAERASRREREAWRQRHPQQEGVPELLLTAAASSAEEALWMASGDEVERLDVEDFLARHPNQPGQRVFRPMAAANAAACAYADALNVLGASEIRVAAIYARFRSAIEDMPEGRERLPLWAW